MSQTKTKEIVRTPTFAGGGITPEEKAKMDAHAQLWIRRAMRTEPIEPEKIIPAIEGLYEVAGLKKPRVIIVPSPLVMAVAGGFAAAIWYSRKNPKGLFATYSATDSATDSATYSATYSATDSATYSATDSATDSATRSATYSATDSATDSATYSALLPGWAYTMADEFCGGNPNLKDLMLRCVRRWGDMYQGGNMWAAWDSYLTACRDILGLQLPEHDKYKWWEQSAIHGGFRLMHEEFCMVSDFPSRLFKDEQHRPHCDDGPSHEWRDGWKLWYIHGVAVTEQIVMYPKTLTIKQIDDESNAEVRRVMIERFGLQRYLTEGGAQIIHQDTDPQNGDQRILYCKEVKDDEPIVMVRVKNSTPEPDGSIKDYFIRVPPGIERAGAAVAWTFGMTEKQYAPLVQT
jgi:hypothetical protein